MNSRKFLISVVVLVLLVSAVAVSDLTRRGREFMAQFFNPIETWAMIALLYLIMTLFSARIVAWLERKTKIER